MNLIFNIKKLFFIFVDMPKQFNFFLLKSDILKNYKSILLR